MQTMDIQDVVKNNPKVDMAVLNQTFSALAWLRQSGVIKPKRYNLSSPFSTRPMGQIRQSTTQCAK